MNMKELKNKDLEELLEIENQNKVLSYVDFYFQKNNIKLELLSLIFYLTQDRFINPKIIFNNEYKKYRESLPIYQIVTNLYHKLLEDLALEIIDSSVEKDPLSLSILLSSYLIPLGLLSYTNRFYHTNSNSLFTKSRAYDYISYIDGAQILTGYGCCRHVTSFISQLLHKMEISTDIITCAQIPEKEILFHMLENLSLNHVIMGYEKNDKYYLMDVYNLIYNLSCKQYYIETGLKYKCVLDYTETKLFQPKLNWNPNLEYDTHTEKEIKEAKNKIVIALNNGELHRFIEFKQRHFDVYQKLAYLTPLELERTIKKEAQKIKRI